MSRLPRGISVTSMARPIRGRLTLVDAGVRRPVRVGDVGAHQADERDVWARPHRRPWPIAGAGAGRWAGWCNC